MPFPPSPLLTQPVSLPVCPLRKRDASLPTYPAAPPINPYAYRTPGGPPPLPTNTLGYSPIRFIIHQIGLIPHQHHRQPLTRQRPRVAEKGPQARKGLVAPDIVHEQRARRAAVVRAGDAAEAFLAGRVPQLQLDTLGVRACADADDFRGEFHADGLCADDFPCDVRGRRLLVVCRGEGERRGREGGGVKVITYIRPAQTGAANSSSHTHSGPAI